MEIATPASIHLAERPGALFGHLGFEALAAHCIIGTLPDERKKKQTVLIDLSLKCDMTTCVATDAVTDTVNYAEVAAFVQKIGEENSYHLIESYAFAILRECFRRYPVFSAKVRVRKPGALPNATCAFVEIEQQRSS